MAASKESAAGVGMSVGDTLSMLNKAMDATSGKGPVSNIPRAGQSKKKSVRWAEEDKLKMIKIVEKLVYGDEFGNEITTSVSFSFVTCCLRACAELPFVADRITSIPLARP